jgi:predicted lipoprotein with Yx(FWY)xxD motif
MKLSLRTLVPATAIVVVAVSLTACGSSSSSKTSTKASSSSSSSSTSSTTTTANATVKTAKNATLGTILVDAQGRTVYTLTTNGADVACSATCMGVWPPVLVPAGMTAATAGPGVPGKLVVVVIPTGKQVQYGGHALYTFVQDTAAGDAKGQGLQSFGGTWNAVKVSGGTASTTPSSKSGGGYGY